MWIVIVLLAAAAIVWLVYDRMNELFALSVRGGRVIVLRGRIPNGLFTSLAGIARHAKLERATIRAVRGQHHARLVFRGVDEGTAQRMRNTFGIHPVRALRAAPLPDSRNLGQLIGVAWLAWALTRR